MTKALLMNSARYLNGASANDTLPSNTQGMGDMPRAALSMSAAALRCTTSSPAD